MNALLTLPLVLAARVKDPVPEAGDVKPGWVLALVIVLLVGVTVLLWWSMRSRIGKVHVDEGDDLADAAQGERPAGHQDGPPTADGGDRHDGHADGEEGGSHPV